MDQSLTPISQCLSHLHLQILFLILFLPRVLVSASDTGSFPKQYGVMPTYPWLTFLVSDKKKCYTVSFEQQVRIADVKNKIHKGNILILFPCHKQLIKRSMVALKLRVKTDPFGS